jgi:hypothetical protein
LNLIIKTAKASVNLKIELTKTMTRIAPFTSDIDTLILRVAGFFHL